MSVFRYGKYTSATRTIGLAAAFMAAAATADAETVVSREPFQKALYAECGNGFTGCAGKVYKVKATQRLELKSAACHFTVRSPRTIISAALVSKINATKAIADYFVPVETGNNNSFRYFAFNTQTLLVARAGDELHVGVNATDDVSHLNCKIAGELLTLQ
jgi:hypothetical protein